MRLTPGLVRSIMPATLTVMTRNLYAGASYHPVLRASPADVSARVAEHKSRRCLGAALREQGLAYRVAAVQAGVVMEAPSAGGRPTSTYGRRGSRMRGAQWGTAPGSPTATPRTCATPRRISPRASTSCSCAAPSARVPRG